MCGGTCHNAIYTFFMKIHSWLLIGTYHRHVDPVLCLDHPLFPPFCKINERAASLLGCNGEVVFTPQNKQILRFCLTFSSIDHKLHWTVQLKISTNSFKTLLITLQLSAVQNPEPLCLVFFFIWYLCLLILSATNNKYFLGYCRQRASALRILNE